MRAKRSERVDAATILPHRINLMPGSSYRVEATMLENGTKDQELAGLAAVIADVRTLTGATVEGTAVEGDGAGQLPRSEFHDPAATVRFMVAGDAYVTLQSTRTGAHFTYRVYGLSVSPHGAVSHFVSVLTGPDSYTYLGCLYDAKVYRHGKKSPIAADAPSAKAFAWTWVRLVSGFMPRDLAVYHEGRCGRCSRRLTDPVSISLGMGPTCREYQR